MIIKNKRIKGFQVYKAKGKQEHAYIWHDEQMGLFVEPAYGAMPSCHCSFSHKWLNATHYPVSFNKMPENYQQHLLTYLKANEEI